MGVARLPRERIRPVFRAGRPVACGAGLVCGKVRRLPPSGRIGPYHQRLFPGKPPRKRGRRFLGTETAQRLRGPVRTTGPPA